MHRFDLDRMSGYSLSKERRASLEFELEQLDELDERKEKIIDKFYNQNKQFTFSNQDGLAKAAIKYFEKNKIGNQTYKDYAKKKKPLYEAALYFYNDAKKLIPCKTNAEYFSKHPLLRSLVAIATTPFFIKAFQNTNKKSKNENKKGLAKAVSKQKAHKG